MRTRKTAVGLVALLALVLAACGGPDPVPFSLVFEPPVLRGIVADDPFSILVTVSSDDPGPVSLTASASGGAVTVDPAAIGPGEVAVVTARIAWDVDEQPRQIVVVGERGGVEVMATASTGPVLDVEDDTAYAGRVLAVFTAWLADNRPDLGLGPSTAVVGGRVAPADADRTHHVFWSDAWEIDITWRGTVRPYDWAEISLRPRAALTPTEAFRLASQRDAFTLGTIDIEPIPAPPSVTR